MYPNNILFNSKSAFSKIPTKHNSFQYNHFLEIISVFYQTYYFQQNTFSKMHSQSRGSKRNLGLVSDQKK